ncbi:DNA topoisomerase [Pseudomonas taiwanensis]|uniref:DNA topoisomerase IB n=1 Tax=Pseudomonas taiwanensis TaxID=470150 RepID=UPI0015BD90AF|nr:DNA topoisomerase IB [Pseudomonas taiwanensis]NWL80401.1 DNA topoisomerase [Pseudomonas taiwanensis]
MTERNNPDCPIDLPAQLRYVDDGMPGIRRRRQRGRFIYLDPEGARIRDPDEVRRIDQLVIPPAYRDVWICPDPNGHLQATGRDARGRKQYRYHPLWNENRNSAKYERLLSFGSALPQLRARIDKHLGETGMGRDKVMATVVALLDETLIRVGNRRYARENNSYGLTTLRNRHINVNGSQIRFSFKGKSGIEHDVSLTSPRLARILRRCLDLPGQQLFQYLDEEGQRHSVGSHDVNDFLRSQASGEFTAKDYRTWAGSALALEALRKVAQSTPDNRTQHVTEMVKQVAQRLGNTPAICRKCYIHPAVVDAFLTGELAGCKRPRKRKGMSPEEVALLQFLQARQTSD